MSDKDDMLATLKAQWKIQIEKDYTEDPQKVKNSDIDKTTDDIMRNPMIKMACRLKGIKRDDVFKILKEIKEEVVKIDGAKTPGPIENG